MIPTFEESCDFMCYKCHWGASGPLPLVGTRISNPGWQDHESETGKSSEPKNHIFSQALMSPPATCTDKVQEIPWCQNWNTSFQNFNNIKQSIERSFGARENCLASGKYKREERLHSSFNFSYEEIFKIWFLQNLFFFSECKPYYSLLPQTKPILIASRPIPILNLNTPYWVTFWKKTINAVPTESTI